MLEALINEGFLERPAGVEPPTYWFEGSKPGSEPAWGVRLSTHCNPNATQTTQSRRVIETGG